MASRKFGVDQATQFTSGIERMTRPGPVQVIAVTGGKGGVGKTCVAVNLAAALAAADKRVLLLDGDMGLANVDVLLGLTPRRTLEHVLAGQCTLDEVIVDAPQGFKVVPAASGVSRLAELSTAEHLGLVQAFSTLSTGLDVMIVDTAAGIADGVRQFCQASQNVLVVVRDEPASLTDAYALIKVLRRDHDIRRFRVLANLTHAPGEGQTLFRKLDRVTARFLDVALEYAGEVPDDPYVRHAIREQRTVIEAYPSSGAGRAFKKLAHHVGGWPIAAGPRGNLEFFVERLVQRPVPKLGSAQAVR
jgi:flagellar biosynthesis protein FlhG